MMKSATNPTTANTPYLIVNNALSKAGPLPKVNTTSARPAAPGPSDWILDVLMDVVKYANNANLTEVEACLRLAHADVATYLRTAANQGR